jgi:UDP-glucose 4-epimerase
MKILIAGASGYFGQILSRQLLRQGHEIFCLDLELSEELPKDMQAVCDVRNQNDIALVTRSRQFDVLIHLATQIDFAVSDQKKLYDNNIGCTEALAEYAKTAGIKKFIFTSSNSVYLGLNKGIIFDDDSPKATDMYGQSKIDSENILNAYTGYFTLNIIRCPNIIDGGRMGMLSILFELLDANATIWTLGDGGICHQTLYAGDLCRLIELLFLKCEGATYNVGSADVQSFKELYAQLIVHAGSRSKIRSVNMKLAILVLKMFYKLGISPMGPYQFRMLTKDFIFDTTRAQRELNWYPTLNNYEMLAIAYDHYKFEQSKSRSVNSANSRPASFKILKLLKFIKF